MDTAYQQTDVEKKAEADRKTAADKKSAADKKVADDRKAANAKNHPGGLRVKALREGTYGGRYREVNDEFSIESEEDLGKWMHRLDGGQDVEGAIQPYGLNLARNEFGKPIIETDEQAAARIKADNEKTKYQPKPEEGYLSYQQWRAKYGDKPQSATDEGKELLAPFITSVQALRDKVDDVGDKKSSKDMQNPNSPTT